jgi:outer membrane protein OmpA-like peptidoglycan-associated protein
MSLHAELLFHLQAFARNARINPFLTAGIGGGAFAYQQALYAPLGAGVNLRVNATSIIILQGQIRKALSDGINGDFMFYSASYAHDMVGIKKHKSRKENVVKDAISAGKGNRKNKTRAVAGSLINNKSVADTSLEKNKLITDSDGDGIADKDDKCPGVKGSKENMGCPFPPVEGADIVSMSTDSVTYNIYFAYDQSELVGYDFAVLNSIKQIVQSDKTLTLHIAGYADSQGTQARNIRISADRAKVTVDYFTSYGIAQSRITSSFHGSGHPFDKLQQWRNRRAEITIIKH